MFAGRSRRSVRAVGWLAIGSAVLACSSSEILVVVARLGDPDTQTNPAVEVRMVALDVQLRRAHCVEAGGEFRVAASPGVRRVLFEIGVEGGPATTRFSIRQGEAVLFETALGPDYAGWKEYAVDLSDAGGALAFATEGSPGTTACWGAVIFLGPSEAERPNVILFSLDTLGADYLGAFGHGSDVSPHIDAFLADSFSFRRAYAQSPNTLVSHSSLFSGQYPIHHHRYGRFLAPLDSLVGSLADAGFHTVSFTENAYVAAKLGFHQGFDRYHEVLSPTDLRIPGNAPATFARARDWLERFGRDTRFFLFVHTYEVHSPYVPRTGDDWAVANRRTPGDARRLEPSWFGAMMSRHSSGKQLLPQRDMDRLAALYSGEIHALDREVGALLDSIDKLGLTRRTLVVLTSDHGEQFGERGRLGHGSTLDNRVLHVPLGFRWPEGIEPGTSDRPVELVDVMPTILELVGVEAPRASDGRSLVPVLRSGTDDEPRPAFAELRRERRGCQEWKGPGPCRLGRYAVQTERFKYVSSEVPRYERLYDLDADPAEEHDVSQSYPEELTRHRALLKAYRDGAVSPVDEPDDAGDLPSHISERLRALGYLE